MTEQKPVRAVLSGCGFWAQDRTVFPYLRANPERLQIVAIGDLTGGEPTRSTLANSKGSDEFAGICKQLEALRLPFPPPSFAGQLNRATLARLREQHQVEAVIVATPNQCHSDTATFALQEKLHVYAERPVSSDHLLFSRLLELAARQQRHLFNGVQRRLEDSFCYLRDVVRHKIGFGNLKRIHVQLASGRRPTGWRLDPARAGGGVLIDEGYHLLDMAGWLFQNAYPDVNPQRLDWEYLREHTTATLRNLPFTPGQTLDARIETEVIAAINLPEEVILDASFSYLAPEGSIFEMVELRDDTGCCVKMVRNMSQRTATPGRLTHQKSNGEFVCLTLGGVKDKEALNAYKIKVDGIVLEGGAFNHGPLAQFVAAIRTPWFNSADFFEHKFPFSVHASAGVECDARLSWLTHEFVRAIYEVGRRRH